MQGHGQGSRNCHKYINILSNNGFQKSNGRDFTLRTMSSNIKSTKSVAVDVIMRLAIMM